jgi:antitoxin component YwqK of YwqJK toxin-antitoxin module
MEKKTKSITITQFDYFIKNVNDEEVDIHGHPNHYSEYDHDGRTLKAIKYNREGDFEEMLEYGYDDQGNLVRESYYPSENEIAEEKTFIRDETGMVLRALKKYQDGSVDTIEHEYNESGQLIKRTTITDEDEIEQVETFEWENGEMVNHQIFDENGELLSDAIETNIKPGQSRITYNDEGQVIKEEELDEDGEVYMTVNRSYDENGLQDEVDVYIDGQGRAISRHYFLKYEYTFFE